MIRNGAFCIMERIPGMTLETAWTSLSWIRTINLALQLRRYVSHLRSMTSLTAGSLATGEFRSFWFQDLFGLPVRSGLEIVADFIKFWAEFVSIPQEVKGRGPDHPKYVPPTPEKFVLIHHDLAPRNILVDPSNQLWLVDWDEAGWHPVYFEYAGMQNFDVPKSWDSFTVGRSEKEKRMLERARYRSQRFAYGRRFEILRNGAPSRRRVS